jgi:hypothetical protein
MDSFIISTNIASRAVRGYASSALPHAPVVPDETDLPSPRTVRSRAALARALDRLARAVAPAPASRPTTAA